MERMLEKIFPIKTDDLIHSLGKHTSGLTNISGANQFHQNTGRHFATCVTWPLRHCSGLRPCRHPIVFLWKFDLVDVSRAVLRNIDMFNRNIDGVHCAVLSCTSKLYHPLYGFRCHKAKIPTPFGRNEYAKEARATRMSSTTRQSH